MSGRWRSAKALKAPNVVCLPTAAQRQVRQPCNKGGRAARAALTRAQPWPGEYIFPGRREALRRAEKIVGVEQTPALAIALAIVAALDEDARLRLIGRIAQNGGSAAPAAIELICAQNMSLAEALDLQWALERLSGGRD